MELKQIQEMERRQLVAESLRSTLAVLNSNLPLEQILAHIVNQAVPLLQADAAAIFRLQENGMLTIQSSRGLGSDYVTLARIPIGSSATGQAALKLRPVNYPDVLLLRQMPEQVDDEIRPVIDLLVTRYRAILSVPLVVRAETYGALTLYYIGPHQTDDEEIALVTSFCDQAALAIENARLRSQIELDAVAAERNRLARDLHDSVTQTLFSASLIAEVLPSVWKRDPQMVEEGLGELRQLTHGALAEMRMLLLELRPNSLQEARLEDLLRQLAESVSGRMRKPVQLQVEGQIVLPRDVRLAFYRIAQEALNNIVKHAQADEISISLRCTAETQADLCNGGELCVVDNGCGFNQYNIPTDHLGVNIMKERAESIGALFSIESREQCGTKISVQWKAH